MRKGQQQRRPLVWSPTNREMLENIKTTLQVKTNNLQQTGQSPTSGQPSDGDGLSQNTPLLTKSASGSQVRRENYNKNALDEIRKTLHPFKTGDAMANTSMESQDSSLSSSDVNKTFLHHLESMGFSEVCKSIFKMSGWPVVSTPDQSMRSELRQHSAHDLQDLLHRAFYYHISIILI